MHLIRRETVVTPGVFPPDRHYWLGSPGFLHASYRMVSPDTARQQAVVLISGCGRPFRIRARGVDAMAQAVLVGPQVLRSLDAVGVELYAFHFAPDHPAFAALAHIAAGGVKLLRRARFAAWDTSMRDALWGTPDLESVRHLVADVAQALQADHGIHFPPDARLSAALQCLDRELDLTLDQLARRAGIASARLSRLFNEQLGLPLRSYQTWRRTAVAWELFAFRPEISLTDAAHEAGYSDSAHMSRTWQRLFGVTPTYMRSEVRSFR